MEWVSISGSHQATAADGEEAEEGDDVLAGSDGRLEKNVGMIMINCL